MNLLDVFFQKLIKSIALSCTLSMGNQQHLHGVFRYPELSGRSAKTYARSLELVHCFNSFRIKYLTPVRSRQVRVIEVLDQRTVLAEEHGPKRLIGPRKIFKIRLACEDGLVKKALHPAALESLESIKFDQLSKELLTQLQSERIICTMLIVGVGYDDEILGDLIVLATGQRIFHQILQLPGIGATHAPFLSKYQLV